MNKKFTKGLTFAFALMACSMMSNVNEVKASNVVTDGVQEMCQYHDQLSPKLKFATFKEDGTKIYDCPDCDYELTEVIPSVKTVELSKTKLTYSCKEQKPTVIVTDSEGKALIEGTDYSLSYSSGRIKTGKYSVKVTLKGNYEGTKTLNFVIVPKAPSTVKVERYGHDDIKVTWSKSTGASGYSVYYKRSTAKEYSLLKRTTGTSVKKADLTDGVKYNFKVVPYKIVDKTRYFSTTSKVVSISTIKLPGVPSSAKAELYGYDDVKFSWSKVDGATGYAVYYKKSTSDKYVLIGHTTKTSVKKANISDFAKYNFKVVPYKKVNGVRYHSPNSNVESIYTLGKMSKPKVTHVNNSTAKVKWDNVKGETGYQVSKSSSKTGTNIVSTTTERSKKYYAPIGTKYYYKVRVYKTVDGKRIYGPWSSSKSFKNAITWMYEDKTATITVTKEYYKNAWCYIAHLEFTDYSRFKTCSANGKWGSHELIGHAHNRLGAILTVNGDYSMPQYNYAVVRNGKVINNKYYNWLPAIYNKKNGLFQPVDAIGGANEVVYGDLKTLVKEGKLTDTFNFGPALLVNGKYTGAGANAGRAQRTTIGTNGKPGDLWIVVSDGRYVDGVSPGLTFRECAELLISKGCNFGIPLDGGGSSSMVFKGQHLNKTSGRAVIDFVYFK